MSYKMNLPYSMYKTFIYVYMQCVKKQRPHSANKSPYSQSYGFSSSHVLMWELDHRKDECWRIDAFELWCWREDSWVLLGQQGDPASPS